MLKLVSFSPDWYVLFSYGYLRWGEYLPQFTVPTGFIGEIVGQPVFPWNAAWWGAALTGIPVSILALPPFLGGREKRPVEDPWFATAGAVYLAHIWFISVFSINIFLELYEKNRSDYCKLDSHGDLLCGVREPWVAEAFNTIPWVMTGVLAWICFYFLARGMMVKAWGAGFKPSHAKQILIGTLLISTAGTVATWDTYDDGFWDPRRFAHHQGSSRTTTIPNLRQCARSQQMFMFTQPTNLPTNVDGVIQKLFRQPLGSIG
jgi:hypothetical protein